MFLCYSLWKNRLLSNHGHVEQRVMGKDEIYDSDKGKRYE